MILYMKALSRPLRPSFAMACHRFGHCGSLMRPLAGREVFQAVRAECALQFLAQVEGAGGANDPGAHDADPEVQREGERRSALPAQCSGGPSPTYSRENHFKTVTSGARSHLAQKSRSLVAAMSVVQHINCLTPPPSPLPREWGAGESLED